MILPVSYMNESPSLTAALPSFRGAVAVTETVYQSGDDGLEHTVDWGLDSDSYMLELEHHLAATSSSTTQRPRSPTVS